MEFEKQSFQLLPTATDLKRKLVPAKVDGGAA